MILDDLGHPNDHQATCCSICLLNIGCLHGKFVIACYSIKARAWNSLVKPLLALMYSFDYLCILCSTRRTKCWQIWKDQNDHQYKVRLGLPVSGPSLSLSLSHCIWEGVHFPSCTDPNPASSLACAALVDIIGHAHNAVVIIIIVLDQWGATIIRSKRKLPPQRKGATW